MSLPNELLHSIIEYLAYIPKLPNSPSKSQFKCASPELLALSVTNWRLRRICLHFLFANINLRHIKDARRLEDSSLVLFKKFTKYVMFDLLLLPLLTVLRLLAIAHFSRSEDDRILYPILPCMNRLEWVELRFCSVRGDFLKAILALSSVSTVLVEQLPDASLHDNLSKVLYEGTSTTTTLSPDLERCLGQGMRLGRLEVLGPELLDDDFGQRHFAGLEELRLSMRRYPVSFSWLSPLSSTHSSLKEVWLIDDNRHYFRRHTPIFISSFVEESQRQDLSKNYIIKRVGLRRGTGQCSQDWCVMSLTIFTTFASTSLLEILTLVSTSFPNLETLTLDLDSHKATYDVDDLAAVLGRCSSLRVLYLHNVFKRLRFGSRCLPTVCRANSTSTLDRLAARAASGLSMFTSRVAKKVLSLDTIYIYDMGYEYEKFGSGKRWYLVGWLHVLNGNRDVDGTVRCKNESGLSDVRLGTKMISRGFETKSQESL
ncbi:hypothetical protein F5050DRAFT_1812199 [Lentinula boryana]|uniref:F-box domain-containing protein n=1 Tax=Lentinula boryana TaxID=40481 RepID=A0ABQ8Q009_9AGAR|nr:hypothetical protein F5050DRAFT_1812199 [Lentinula boryana]